MFSFKLGKVSNYTPVLLSVNIYARLTVQLYISVSENCKEPTSENVQSVSDDRAKSVIEEFVGLKTVVTSLNREESPILK